MPAASQPASETAGPVLPWILRLGVAGCFIGHGVFGIITKSAWVPYFGVVGITEAWAWRLMPVIGAMDIAIGCLALLWPTRALFMWAAAWAAWTALLRPLSGESGWEFLERAGNYGVPLAILAVTGWRGPWFARLNGPWPRDQPAVHRLTWTLRLTTATLLAGHAGCMLVLRKAVFEQHYAVFGGSPALIPWIGFTEFLLAAVALILPRPALLFGLVAWKLGAELLYPLSGAPIWEFIERCGSYAAPLALGCLLLSSLSTEKSWAPSPVR